MRARHATRFAFLASLLVTGLVLVSCGGSGGGRGPSTSSSTATAGGPTPAPLVDPGEIVSLLAPDSIPSIDHPKFLSVSRVDFLDPREPILAIDVGGDAKAYPVQILIWHEIVNDVVGGMPVALTYCPLCNTGIAFGRPTIDGQLLDFGTSGKLYQSNLVMYDRQTQSLWPQALGEAVIGPLTGTKLRLVPVQMVSWGDWKAEHPDGGVLSRNTGASRPYGENPYGGYDRPNSSPFAFGGAAIDPRLPPKARVVGVQVGDDVEAFPYDVLSVRALGGWSAVTDRVGGRIVVVFWKEGTVSAVDAPVIADSRSVGSTGVFDLRVAGRTLTFRATSGGIVDEQTGSGWDIFGRAVSGPLAGTKLRPVVSTESFWFDWAAFHPDTRIYGVVA